MNANINYKNFHISKREAFHGWYKIIMGFESKLVKYAINELDIKDSHLVFDPFCGSGTTLVECKTNGIRSIGIDINPVCVLASRVKTYWKLKPEKIMRFMPLIIDTAKNILIKNNIQKHPSYIYLLESGMISRGWISNQKAKKVIALLKALEIACHEKEYYDFYQLGLIASTVQKIADIKFGPELYCLTRPKRSHVFSSFVKTIQYMVHDLINMQQNNVDVENRIYFGDSRTCDKILSAKKLGPVDYIITSPPYPNEHDYTRNTRLELAILGYVCNNDQLRKIKYKMIRCNTKGIYVKDNESRVVDEFEEVNEVCAKLNRKANMKSDGFSKLYGKMVKEYFGGMFTHLKAAYNCLKPKGQCIYVLCDQKSLLGVYLNTPEIFKRIATSKQVGFNFIKEIDWRQTRGTTGNKILTEKMLLFAKPDKQN